MCLTRNSAMKIEHVACVTAYYEPQYRNQLYNSAYEKKKSRLRREKCNPTTGTERKNQEGLAKKFYCSMILLSVSYPFHPYILAAFSLYFSRYYQPKLDGFVAK